MGANQDRADFVKQLFQEWEVTTELVQDRLRCGRGQALRAIRTARAQLADDGKRVSYATQSNGFIATMEGDGPDRTRSYVSRLQSINTQQRNAARVMAASVDHGRSARLERAVAAQALAALAQAEADQHRLEAMKELLP